MEIKKQLEFKEVKYPENLCNGEKRSMLLKSTTLFSTLLFSMISNSTAYGVENAIDLPLAVGVIQAKPTGWELAIERYICSYTSYYDSFINYYNCFCS